MTRSANHFAAVSSVQLCTEGTKLWPDIFWWWEKKCLADGLEYVTVQVILILQSALALEE